MENEREKQFKSQPLPAPATKIFIFFEPPPPPPPPTLLFQPPGLLVFDIFPTTLLFDTPCLLDTLEYAKLVLKASPELFCR